MYCRRNTSTLNLLNLPICCRWVQCKLIICACTQSGIDGPAGLHVYTYMYMLCLLLICCVYTGFLYTTVCTYMYMYLSTAIAQALT